MPDGDLRLNANLLRDESEFNKPLCTYNSETGECPKVVLNRGCTTEFQYCINGWTCKYYCKHDLVYNPKSSQCQRLHSCYKSMLESDL